jgi:hypothetical protein
LKAGKDPINDIWVETKFMYVVFDAVLIHRYSPRFCDGIRIIQSPPARAIV